MTTKSEEKNKAIDKIYEDLRRLKHISEYKYRKQRYEYYKQWIEADSAEKREIKHYDDPSDYATNLLDEYKDRFIFKSGEVSEEVSECLNELIGKEFFLGLSVEVKCFIFSDVVKGDKKIAKQLFDSLGEKIQAAVLKGVVENHDNFDIGSCDIELINLILINLAKQMNESIFDNFPDELKGNILNSCNGDLLVRINNLSSNCNYGLDVGSFEDQKKILCNAFFNSVKNALKNKIVNKEPFKAGLIHFLDVYNDGTDFDKGNSSYTKKLNTLKDWVIAPEKVSVPNDAMIALNYLCPWYGENIDAEIETKLKNNNLVNGGQYSQVEVREPSVNDLCKHIKDIDGIVKRIILLGTKSKPRSKEFLDELVKKLELEPGSKEFLDELAKKLELEPGSKESLDELAKKLESDLGPIKFSEELEIKYIVERKIVELLSELSYSWTRHLYNIKAIDAVKEQLLVRILQLLQAIATKKDIQNPDAGNKKKAEAGNKKKAEAGNKKKAEAGNSMERFYNVQEDLYLTVSGKAFTNAIIELIGKKGEGKDKKNFSEIYWQLYDAAKNEYGRIDNNGREILRSDERTRSMLNNCREVINELKKNNKLSPEDADKVLKNITYNKTVKLINDANLDEKEKKEYLEKIEPSKSVSMDEEIDGRRVVEPSYKDRYSYEGDNADVVSGVISKWIRFVKSKDNLKPEELENLRNYFSYTIFTVKDEDIIHNIFTELTFVYDNGIEDDIQCFNWEIIGFIARYYQENHKIPTRDEIAIRVSAGKDSEQGTDKEVSVKKIKKSFANKCDNVRKKYAADFQKYCKGY